MEFSNIFSGKLRAVISIFLKILWFYAIFNSVNLVVYFCYRFEHYYLVLIVWLYHLSGVGNGGYNFTSYMYTKLHVYAQHCFPQTIMLLVLSHLIVQVEVT